MMTMASRAVAEGHTGALMARYGSELGRRAGIAVMAACQCNLGGVL